MTVYPLIQRELAVAIRRPSTLRLRILFGVGMMSIMLWALLVWNFRGQAFGQVVFRGLTNAAYLGALLTGVLFTSDSISRERREGALGLLFLTDLTPREILFGKIAAGALVPATCLLALFPAFAFCQLAGALLPSEFWRVMLAIFNALFYSLAVSICVSTLGQNQRSVFATCSLLLLLIGVVVPVLILGHGASGPEYLLLLFSPFSPCYFAFHDVYAVNGWSYWLSIVCTQASAWGIVFLAGNFLKNGWQDSELNRPESKSLESAETRAAKQSVQDQEPISWLMFRRENQRSILGLALLGCGLASAAYIFQGPMLLYVLLLCLHVPLRVMVALRPAQAFHADRQNGAFELLLSTPLTMEDVFSGYIKGLQHRWRFGLIILTGAHLFIANSLISAGEWTSLLLVLGLMITMWLDFYAIAWLAALQGLMHNHLAISLAKTLFRAPFVPIALIFIGKGIFYQATLTTSYVFWVILAGANAALSIHHAKTVLRQHGRSLMLRPWGESTPHIESSWSFINWQEEFDHTQRQQPRQQLVLY